MRAEIDPATGIARSLWPCQLGPPMRLREFFEKQWPQHGDRIAYIEAATERHLTYAELHKRVVQIAASLRTAGLSEKTMVAVCFGNTLEATLTVLALMFAEVPLLFMQPTLNADELQPILRTEQPHWVFVDSETERLLNSVKADHPYITTVENVLATCERKCDSELVVTKDLDPRTLLACMSLTSGSTGPQKSVMYSHWVMLEKIYLRIFGDPPLKEEPSVYSSCSLLAHLSGFAYSLLVPLGVGHTVVHFSDMVPKTKPEEYLQSVIKYQVRHALLMPVALQKLLEVPKSLSDQCTSLRFVTSGGQRLPIAVFENLLAKYPALQIQMSYGLSEVSGFISTSTLNATCMFDTGYWLYPYTEVRIMAEDEDRPLPQGEDGEIWLRTESAALGYLNNEKATKETFVDGWIRSGDIGHISSDGRLHVIARMKELIKCMDHNISPTDIENVILTLPEIDQAIVVGIPGTKYGEAPIAFVVLKRREDANGDLKAKINSVVQARLAPHKHLYGGIEFVGSYPMTESGKFSRRKLVELHLAEQLDYIRPEPIS